MITDMSMPNMTGDQLAKAVIEIRPEMPVIMCSGFSERMNREKASEIGIKAFLMKPVVRADLAQTVRRVLNAPSSAVLPNRFTGTRQRRLQWDYEKQAV